jgi:DNA polymerase/3'-5' exonuclease PolX
MLCGGIRRGESTIDELIYVVYLFSIDRKPKLDNNTKILEYSDKSIKFEGYKGITVTMKFVDNCSYPFMTLYNTGPTEFIVKVKSTLKRKLKLGLNEYGFIREDGSIITNDLGTEEEIFEYLGFEYLNPHNR